MAPYATATDELNELGGQDAVAVDEALEAGAFDIDSAFTAGGYVAPIDLTVIVEPTKARLTGKLSVINLALAARNLSTASSSAGARGQAQGVKKDHEDALKWLELVRTGKLSFANVPRSGGQSGISVAGKSEFDQEAVGIANDIVGAAELIGRGSSNNGREATI